ncbi:MAG: DNA repair protein RecN [Coriobacteriia bacterium]|nr:DNA repair protein RecN [Coriobacteriia bacterium]
MLEELHVRDLALIEEAWLGFGSGMTVLTGETGAGKTVLLGALKLLVGERADTSAVRAGAVEAVVEGTFTASGCDLIVRRRVSADGRSRCVVDGEMATVGALAERVGPLVDLHGQHEHQALLATATHIGFLDRWAPESCEPARATYREAFEAYAQSVGALAQRERLVAEALHDADRLRFLVDEVDKVAPAPGEDEMIEARLPAWTHAERLAEAASEAVGLLRGDGGALDAVSAAQAALARLAGIDPALDDLAARVGEAGTLVDDASATLRRYRDGVEHDPAALDAAHVRLAALTSLKRRYGPTLGDVIDARERAAHGLAAVDAGEEALAEARALVERTGSTLKDAGGALDGVRRAAAPGFSEALGREAAELAMTGASFEIAFADLPWGQWNPEGPHTCEFLYSPAEGQPARSLARIASGGELSRVMLALKGVLGSADRVETLVFDEVDAGIGGATAISIGQRLARLARTHQVIVVTHLAQVAAFADAHLVVRKLAQDEGVATTVVPVEGEDRVAEIARMLSGAVSDASRMHAAELLAQAREA